MDVDCEKEPINTAIHWRITAANPVTRKEAAIEERPEAVTDDEQSDFDHFDEADGMSSSEALSLRSDAGLFKKISFDEPTSFRLLAHCFGFLPFFKLLVHDP